MENVIKDILDFARPSPPEFREVDIHKVIASSIKAVNPEYEESGLKIKKTYKAAPAVTWIDDNQILQVFVNLLLNAKEAMSEGGTVDIKTLSKKGKVEVQISDNGIGIEPKNLQEIFNPLALLQTSSCLCVMNIRSVATISIKPKMPTTACPPM